MKSKSKSGKQKDDKKEKKPKDRGILMVGTYVFEECPVNLLTEERGFVKLIDLVNWSEEMHTPLFGDHLNTYTNFYFQARRVIISEQRKIENEEMKESRGNKDIKSQNKRPYKKRPPLRKPARRTSFRR